MKETPVQNLSLLVQGFELEVDESVREWRNEPELLFNNNKTVSYTDIKSQDKYQSF